MKGLLSSYKKLNRSEDATTSSQVINPNSEAILKLWEESQHAAQAVVELPSDNFEIALLFIIIDTLPYEVLWRHWIDINQEVASRVRIYVHAKFPDQVRSEWVRSHLVPFSFRPAWASVEIAKAMIKLLEYSLDHSDRVMKFIYVSESCLPVTPLHDTLTSLATSDSWINWRSSADNGYSQQLQFAPLEKYFPSGVILKADQWVCLNRHHAIAIVKAFEKLSVELWRAFKMVNASDEMVIPTMLALTGFIHSDQTPPALDISHLLPHWYMFLFV